MHRTFQIRNFRGTVPSLKLTKGRKPLKILGHEPKGSKFIWTNQPAIFERRAVSFREVYLTDSSVLFLFLKLTCLNKGDFGYNLVEGYPAEMGTKQCNSCDILMKFLEPQTGCSKYRFLSFFYHLFIIWIIWDYHFCIESCRKWWNGRLVDLVGFPS